MTTAIERIQSWQGAAKTHMEGGHWLEAEPCLQKALQEDAHHPLTQSLLGQCYLAQGNIEQGWSLFQRGRQCDRLRAWPQSSMMPPLWQGGEFPQGSRVLVLSEKRQDTLFYSKYLALFLGAHPKITVTLECDEFLRPVFQYNFPNVSVVTLDIEAGTQDFSALFDTALFLGDLTPLYFAALRLDKRPYLAPTMAFSNQWRQVLSQYSGLKIGLFFENKAEHIWEAWSLILSTYPAITFIDCRHQPTSATPQGMVSIAQVAHCPTLSGDVYAALLASLDGVIGLEGMETQLAAAMGVETWIIGSRENSWHGPVSEAKPWYGNAHYFYSESKHDGRELLPVMAHEIKRKQAEYDEKAYVSQLFQAKQFEALLKRASVCSSTGMDAELWMQKGMAEAQTGRKDAAEGSFRQALALQPFWPETSFNLAIHLRNHRKLYEASQWFEKTHTLQPRNYQAANAWANTLKELGELTSAISIYRHIIKGGKRQGPHSNLLMALNGDPNTSNEQLLNESRQWGALHFKAKPLTDIEQPFRQRAEEAHKKIRVGYLSPDFRQHPVAFFIEPLLRQHDKQRFEVFAYSNVVKADEINATFQGYVDYWRDISGLTDKQVAQKIISDGIDILIDLAGHTAGHRLGVFYFRPASVQMSYLGYPNTTGLPVTDYLITDQRIAPPSEGNKYYTEQLLYLPDCFFCYRPPSLLVAQKPAPVRQKKHLTFGVFNNYLMKAHPMMLNLWAEILQRIPDAVLRIQSIPFAEETFRTHFLQKFLQRGVSAAQLQLVPAGSFHDYLSAYNDVDIVLDTFPWNGHTTTCHGLWMGTPTLTLTGAPHASRMGMSILKTLNLEHWVTYSPEAYIERACYWNAHKDEVEALKKELKSRFLLSALCDEVGFTANFEAVLQAAFNR